ncbi:sigma-54 interaction domain-containing protein [Desulfospira joergensenii]|uniref:sigma-54 interaction domain-containing protein n=1 Tax=Desulfospira joergensenii TaxID=53329 RepID=UPI0003B5FFD2|nr:sigma-54-dependent Fis family transcriptional regulator [Desulfospira joergensenii]
MDISKHWKRIVDTLLDGILVVDTGGTILSTNPSAERLTGYSKEELEGNSCRILNCTGCKIIGKGKGKDYCKLFSVGRSKIKKCMITNKDNHSVHILKSARVLENKEGEVIGAVEILTDMTAVVRKQQEIEALKKIYHLDEGFSGILGKTPAMERLFQLIQDVSQSDVPVLIQGESGTGKELVAMAIHKNSPRKDGPFIKVNCAALNESLLESELFGHVKGSFTGADRDRIGRFEAASGGTIFLDEIGDIPLSTQVKLLRVLEEKEIERVGDHRPFPVDVRIVSATNRDLETLIQKGEFRKDLFFRISVFPLHCPSLARRKDDIPLIIKNFIQQNCTTSQKDISGLSSEAMECLVNYDWPGNVRELRNTIEYAFVLCPGGRIEAGHIPQKIAENHPDDGGESISLAGMNGTEREDLLRLLRKTRGNQSQAARIMGISRVTLWKRIKKHKIRIPEDI